jgi:hypothetical protein
MTRPWSTISSRRQSRCLRVVQQRRRQLAAHPLAERELPHRRVEERPQLEQLRERGEVAPVPLRRDAVDVAEQLERVAQRQVPPELHALADADADAARELDAAP